MVTVRFRGQIVSGSEEYSFIGIEENINSKGALVGLNVLMSNSANFERSYDDWVEDYPSLLEYLRERNWVIKWLPTGE